jgi:hypothetical protein
MKIDKPGVYDMPNADYQNDPCEAISLSATLLKIMLRETPQHVYTASPRLNQKYEPDEDGAFDIGTAAHSLMLGDPKKFAVLDFDDWRKKEAKEARETARAEGKIPLLAKHWDRLQHMVAIGRQQLDVHFDASDAFTDGKPEQSLFWQESGIWCRARLDWLPNNLRKPYDDYKSTDSANPDTFQRVAYSVGHDIQAAFYRRGIRAVLGVEKPRIRFIVQEIAEPFALSAIELNDEAMDLADYKIDLGLARWRWCLENNSWPGYPARTCVIGPPAWHEGQVLAREEADAAIARQMGVKPGAALLEQSLRFQSPNPQMRQ